MTSTSFFKNTVREILLSNQDELPYFYVISKLENFVPLITLLVLGDKAK